MTKLEIANVIRDFSLDAENMFGEIDLVKELRKFADRVEDDEGSGGPLDSAPVKGSPGYPAPADLHLHRHGEER